MGTVSFTSYCRKPFVWTESTVASLYQIFYVKLGFFKGEYHLPINGLEYDDLYQDAFLAFIEWYCRAHRPLKTNQDAFNILRTILRNKIIDQMRLKKARRMYEKEFVHINQPYEMGTAEKRESAIKLLAEIFRYIDQKLVQDPKFLAPRLAEFYHLAKPLLLVSGSLKKYRPRIMRKMGITLCYYENLKSKFEKLLRDVGSSLHG